MGKLLTWILLGAAIWFGMKFVQISQRRRHADRADDRADDRAAEPGTGASQGPAVGAEPMVRCDRCGVHLPASEAIRAAGRTWCSAAHRDA
jgi:uncharacterized protein